MDLQSSLVPRTGSVKYSYRDRELPANGTVAMLFGFIFFAAAAAMLVGVTYSFINNPGTVEGPIWIYWVFLLVFMAAGGSIFWYGLAGILAAKNEKIIFAPDHFEVINRFGRKSIRCRYDQILNANESVMSPRSHESPRAYHRCAVTTEQGKFIFSDGITRYEQLRDFFVQKQTDPSPKTVFNYRCTMTLAIAAFVFLFTFVICFVLTLAYVNHEQITLNGVRQACPLYAPLTAYAMSIFFWIWVGSGAFQSLFERIIVSDGRVVWYGPSGRIKLEILLTEIAIGSFELVEASGRKGGSIYQVGTAKGKLEWDDSISHCSDLVRIMKKASDHLPLQSDLEDS